jgi:hypothetical protein
MFCGRPTHVLLHAPQSQERLPQGTRCGAQRPMGKAPVPAPFAAGSVSAATPEGANHVNAYACMTFQPLTSVEMAR